ncbi:unnamed protein product [Enterobius vermicularis]|uniref:non-specific serine/threonine protein kinase n=1 Tax=Enterobius vermicularis TaxID=51028 RepID=A0A0N4VQC7_ENTVE|nr:unnamed protein product [Enterobius vermicularis]
MSVDLPNSREGSCCDNNDDNGIQQRLPQKNCLIKGRQFSFAIGRQISVGKFGAVYEVLRQSDGKCFAAKLELCDAHFHGLNVDYSVLDRASKKNLKHFTELIDFGKIQGHFKFIIMTMLDKNITQLRSMFVGNRFSLSTALRLGLQTLSALQELHSLGYVHRDVKGTNFVVSHEPHPNLTVYIIDFGLCRSYRNADNEIKPPRQTARFRSQVLFASRGTTRYASLAAHNEKEQAPRDDLESWFYMLIEMISGDSNLPFSSLFKSNNIQ